MSTLDLLSMLAPSEREFIKTASRKAAPREANGLILRSPGGVVYVIDCVNQNREHSTAEGGNMWGVSDADIRAAEDAGADAIGSWHSHYGESADPSDADREGGRKSGMPGVIYSVTLDTWGQFGCESEKAPLLGRRFVHGIHDCAALVIDYYEKLGLKLPDPPREWKWWKAGKNLYFDHLQACGFSHVPLKEIREHDLLLFNLRSDVPNHAAVYLGDGVMIHHPHPRLSCEGVFNGRQGSFAAAFYGAYRPKLP